VVRAPALTSALGLAVAILSWDGAARAQTPVGSEPPAPLRPTDRPHPGSPSDGALLHPPSSPYDAGQAMKAAGIARTSLDRSFERSGVTTSLGFLCGLQPQAETHGGSGARGVDEDGRFLGAQLRFGFR